MRNDETMTVSAAEFQRNIGRYQDIALTRPVAITKNGRERTILISADEYNRLKQRDRKVILAGELTEKDVKAIQAAEIDPKDDFLKERTQRLEAVNFLCQRQVWSSAILVYGIGIISKVAKTVSKTALLPSFS